MLLFFVLWEMIVCLPVFIRKVYILREIQHFLPLSVTSIYCYGQDSRNLKKVGSQQEFLVANKNLCFPLFFEIFLNTEIKLPIRKIKYLHHIGKLNIITHHRAICWETSFLLLSFFVNYHIISTRYSNLRVKKMYWI